MRYRCPLGRIQPQQMDKEEVKRLGYHETGYVVIHADDPRLDFVEREIIKRVATRFFGERVTG